MFNFMRLPPLRRLMLMKAITGGGSWSTITGNPVSFTAIAAPLKQLQIAFSPVQDLHGYDSPWPAGGGKNILPPRTHSSNIYNAGHLIHVSSGETVYVYGEWTYTSSPQMYVRVFNNEGETNKNGDGQDPTGPYLVSGTAKSFVMPIDGYFGICYNSGVSTYTIEKMMVSRSPIASPADYAPYSNICPISGWDGADIYLQSAYDPTAQPTISISFGSTVYSGTLDVLTGVVKARPYYASYNGETLVGPWISSMDKYVAGATPTVGAQVVDMGGAETTIQLTPQEVSSLLGENNMWSDANGDLTVEYRSN